MKIVASFSLLLGLTMAVFAIAAYSELDAATKSVAPTSSMVLTKLVCPQLVVSNEAGTSNADPVALVRLAFSRVYMIGGGSLLLTIVGALLLMGKRATETTEHPR